MYEKWILLFSPCKTSFWCWTSLVSVFFTRNLLSSWNRLLDRVWVLVIFLWRVISNCLSLENRRKEGIKRCIQESQALGSRVLPQHLEEKGALWNSAESRTGSSPSCLASRDGAVEVASHCASFQWSTAHAFICSSEFLSVDLAPAAHFCLNNSGTYI